MPVANTTSSAGPRVLALIADRTGGSRLRAAFGDSLVEFATEPELVAAGRKADAALVIVTPRDHAGRLLTGAVAAIHASRRSAPVYVYVDRSDDGIRALIPLARAGALGVILPNVDDDPSSLRRLLEYGSLRNVTAAISLAAQGVISRRHLPLVLQCLEHLEAPVSAPVLARRLRVSRRTLSTWAAKAGSRGVRSLTSKVRVLAAIAMMRGSDRVIESIAHDLQFSSSAQLYNTVRRYTGMRPREAAQRDIAYWIRCFFTEPGPVRVPLPRLPPAETIVPRAEWPRTPNDAILPPRFRRTPEEHPCHE